jgi:hypothetical protein
VSVRELLRAYHWSSKHWDARNATEGDDSLQPPLDGPPRACSILSSLHHIEADAEAMGRLDENNTQYEKQGMSALRHLAHKIVAGWSKSGGR